MEQLYTFTVFTENRVGLLNQISIIFTRRRLNIESLSVSASAIEGVHKFTITTWSDLDTMIKVVKHTDMAQKIVMQIEKRIDVLKAFVYTDADLVYQEIALYKVPTDKLVAERDLETIIRAHNARILEIDKEFTVIEKAGHYNETEALFNELKKYGILQFARSGRVAVTKINDEPLNRYLDEQQKRHKTTIYDN